MSLANPNYGAGMPPITASNYNPYAFASAQAFAGSILPMAQPAPYAQAPAQNYPIYMPQSSYTPIAPFPPSTSYQAPVAPSYTAPAYAGAQAYAGTGYPPITSSYPLTALASASAQAYNAPIANYPPVSAYPPVGAQASASSSASSDNQLLMMLIMMLTSMNNKPNNNGQYQPRPMQNNQGRPGNNQQADILQKDRPQVPPQVKSGFGKDGWGHIKKGATPKLRADGNWEMPADEHGIQKPAIIAPDGQVIQKAIDPLAFDIAGDGINTSNEVVKANIDGKEQTVNNVGKDDAVLTLNGSVLGDNADLSQFGITEKPKDAQDAFRLIAEKAAKDGLIKDAKNLSEEDLDVLNKKFGLSVRVGDLNGQDKSFAEAGIKTVNLSKAETKTQKNFDGKGNDLATNGTSFTRNDGTKGDVADIWFKSKVA